MKYNSEQYPANKFNIIVLASLGAGLEFFDFTIYALFAHYISINFFPNSNHQIALLETFATFALGYVTRPLGGIFFGHIGDKYGRKYAFSISVFVMAIATLCIGCLPNYFTIGIFAPLLLILLRLIQGFSLGGEIPSATVFTMEHFKHHRPGFLVGLVFMCITFGNALASAIGYGLTHWLSNTQMISWGWRIPFIFGFLLGIISYFLRKKSLETPEFLKISENRRTYKLPVAALLKFSSVRVMMGFTLPTLIVVSISFFLFMPTYLHHFLGYQPTETYFATTIGFIFLGLMCPVFGWISDIFSRKNLIICGCLLTIICGYYLFNRLIHHTFIAPWLFSLAFAFTLAIVNGTYAIAIAEIFPVSLRISGMGFCYNLSFAIFGGLTPVLMMCLLNITNNMLIPYFYIMICALITLLSSLFLKIRHRNYLLS